MVLKQMFMQKKAQSVMVGVMVAITVLIATIVLIVPLKEVITTARSVTYLDCTNTSITTMTKATCVVVDMYLFYFVGVAIFGGLTYITAKKIVDMRTQ